MRTDHTIHTGDSRELDHLSDDSVELVVTSPPYPMIEMWDGTFGDLNSEISARLDAGDGRGAFELMHEELRKTWNEVARVLVDGGIACVNIGDATRSVDGSFRVFPNHARTIQLFEEFGFDPLPEILWRKPVNSAAKFMGSGMLPPNAYATLEHEYILPFRYGGTRRSFEPHASERYEAAYFWEERNTWFSDVWMDVAGSSQALDDDELRERSGAFPFEIPYRLINMFSVYGDTVLDPFWGTGTTTLAAMAAGRSSIGAELRGEFVDRFPQRVEGITDLSREVVEDRLEQHRAFATARAADGDHLEYDSNHYDFSVMTQQERDLMFYIVENLTEVPAGYRVEHAPHPGDASSTDPDVRSPVSE